jgi:hypothetical protein
VGQELPGVLLLQLNQPLVEVGEPLGEPQQLVVGHSVARFVGAADVQVEVRVDAAVLELGDEEVQPVELGRIEGAGVVAGGFDQALRGHAVQEVKPDAVDPVPGELLRQNWRGFLRGDRRHAGDVHSPDPKSAAARPHQVSALRPDETVLSGGRFE